MDVFCRACMCQFPKNSIDNIDSYNIFQINNLADKLMQCSNLPIKPSDEYPHLLCGKCFEKVKDFHEFQIMCKESLKTFKEILMINHNGNCANLTHNVSKAGNTSARIQEDTLCELDWEGKLINISHSIELETEEDLIIEDEGSEYDGNHSAQSESLIQNAVYEKPETKHADPIEKFNGSTYVPQTSVELEHLQNTFSDKGKSLDNEYTLMEYLNESEEECVVDTISEDDDESRLDSQEYVPPLDCNPTTILKYQFHCDLCPNVFRYKHSLTAHIRRHQGLGSYTCKRKNCTRSYSRLCDLRQHLREHDGIPREVYKCDVDNCGKEYTTKSSINMHMRKQHNFGSTPGTRKYVCDVCGSVLANARSLREHHFIHVDKSHWPFGCDVKGCTYRFRKTRQLKEHKNRHAGIKPYVCPHCDKRFCTSSNLGVHVNYHTQERKWPCNCCNRVFFTPANLRLHIQKKHEPDQVGTHFPCRICEKPLSTHTARKYHEMRHTGEKPYVCEECGRGFTQPSALKTHRRIHLEMESCKGYVCHVCHRAFTSLVSLKHHELKHTGEKPYECEQCGIRFRYPNNLSRHRKHNLCKKLRTTKEDVREEVDDMEISVVELDEQYEVV